MKPRTFLVLGVLVVMLGATAFVAPAALSAPLAQTGGGGDVVSPPADQTQPALDLAAFWTPEKMAAAVPMETVLDGSPTALTDLSLQETGTPGSVAGDGPGGASAAASMPQLGGDIQPASTIIYSYPYPYNRSFIAWQWTTWFPFLLNGRLYFNQNGVSYVCSAAVVTSGSGGNNRLILTRGRCIHDGSGVNAFPHWSSGFVFCPGYNNGVGPYGCWWQYSASSIFVLTAWLNGDYRYDYGFVLSANTNWTGAYSRVQSTLGSQGIAWNQGSYQQFWEYAYPVLAPFDGAYQILVSASTAIVDSTLGACPCPLGTGSDMTSGADGGPWVQWARIGGSGYANGVNSYKYGAQPAAYYSPYFGTDLYTLWNTVRTAYP